MMATTTPIWRLSPTWRCVERNQPNCQRGGGDTCLGTQTALRHCVAFILPLEFGLGGVKRVLASLAGKETLMLLRVKFIVLARSRGLRTLERG